MVVGQTTKTTFLNGHRKETFNFVVDAYMRPTSTQGINPTTYFEQLAMEHTK